MYLVHHMTTDEYRFVDLHLNRAVLLRKDAQHHTLMLSPPKRKKKYKRENDCYLCAGTFNGYRGAIFITKKKVGLNKNELKNKFIHKLYKKKLL